MRLVGELGRAAEEADEVAIRELVVAENPVARIVVPLPRVEVHRTRPLAEGAPAARDAVDEEPVELAAERGEVVERLAAGRHPAAVRVLRAAAGELEIPREQIVFLLGVGAFAVDLGEPLGHLRSFVYIPKPDGIVGRAELGRVARDLAVLRPVRIPLLALLQRDVVEVEVAVADVAEVAVAVREEERAGVYERPRDVHALRDICLVDVSVSAHVTRAHHPPGGAHHVHAHARAGNRREIAVRTRPVLDAALELRTHERVGEYLSLALRNRRRAGEHLDSRPG